MYKLILVIQTKYPIMSYMCIYIMYIVHKLKIAFKMYNLILKLHQHRFAPAGFFSVSELSLLASLHIHLS